MQRLHKALPQRRAGAIQRGWGSAVAKRHQLYQVSVSAVAVSWILIFLLSSPVSDGGNGSEVICNSIDGQVTVIGEAALADDVVVVKEHEGMDDLQVLYESTLNHPVEKSTVSENAIVSDQFVTNFDDSAPPSSDKSMASECCSIFTDMHIPLHEEGSLAKNDVHLLKSEDEILPEVHQEEGSRVVHEEPARVPKLPRITPVGLDEFKHKALAAKRKAVSSQSGAVVHRVEPSGKEYNYASASKGAKVLDYNKEAKGASNILDKDKDKYLRNPCSAEGKFVVIELAEETLVDAFEIANFERYSSNVKDIELLSSLGYPPDQWEKLGNYTAANCKHAQRFMLSEPKWARYLKLNLLSHYGTEFYCTLSTLEVYGVDVVEKMLEDLISAENQGQQLVQPIIEQVSLHEAFEEHEPTQESIGEVDDELEDDLTKVDSSTQTSSESLFESRALQVGRIPGDTVLKVLMQKVQYLDGGFSIVERYIEELNSRYTQIFKEFDEELDGKEFLLEKIKSELKNLQSSSDDFVKEVAEILSWKLTTTLQLEQITRAEAMLRKDIEDVQNRQVDMEKKGLAVIFFSFIFGCIAAAKVAIGIILSIFRTHGTEKYCGSSSAWLLLLLSSCIVASVMVL